MPYLIVITGATGSGKTDIAVQLASRLRCHIISADSRQIYRGLPIGTAAPTPEQLSAVPHHFVGCLDLDQYYSAACFEADSLALLEKLFRTDNYAVMCGGSMMYIDAVTRGLDELPTVSDSIRSKVYDLYEAGGIDAIRDKLQHLDPVYAGKVDPNNYKRIIHAIEVSLQAGVPYSSLCTGKTKKRPFEIIKVALDLERAELFDRINRRVDRMIADGLEREADGLFSRRHLNSLNTVGYKELFAMMEGKMDRETAIARIAKNTRVYAKKQLTWLKRDPELVWLRPELVVEYVMQRVGAGSCTVDHDVAAS